VKSVKPLINSALQIKGNWLVFMYYFLADWLEKNSIKGAGLCWNLIKDTIAFFSVTSV